MENQSAILKQKINNIRMKNDECTQILNSFGIDYNDFSASDHAGLYKIVDLQLKTGLAVFDLTYLQEWYCQKVEQNIPTKIAVQSVLNDVSDLDYELVRVQQKTKAAERFLADVTNNAKSTKGIERVFEEKRCEYNLLQDRKNKLKVDINVDMDEIVHKVELMTK